MTDWTPKALEAEYERRREIEARGLCPDSGYSIGKCWAVDLCDCSFEPPNRCLQCGTEVWDLGEHDRRRHT
jgi:hypothetical protein